VLRETLHFGALFAGAAVALGLAIPVARGDAQDPMIGVSEIHEGMKGYGLTVFHGTEPERFDVEVIGILHEFRPGEDLILIKTPHARLNLTKAVAGMSGSPIFLGGRLAGAYSYSMGAFPLEPIAGVTPIHLMMTELTRPIPPGFWPLQERSPLPTAKPRGPQERHAERSGATSFDGPPGQYDLLEHARQVATRMGGAARATSGIERVATPILLAGVGDRTAAFVRTLLEPLGLEPLAAGGGQGTTEGAPEHYVDGGALGVQLISGDVSMMGLGTVTHVVGNKLVAFGHPMMGAGNSALPTTIGRVLWLHASDQRSFKIGESARPLGALVQDRQTAIVIDEKQVAPTFPVDVSVSGADGAPKKSWHMAVVDERFMSAGFVATALASVVEATVAEQRDVTWRMHSKVTMHGHAPIELDDFGVAVGGMPDIGEWSHSRVVHAVGDMLNNPWENARIDGVESSLTVQFARDLWRLRGVELLDATVDAGQKARIRLHLLPFAGREIVKEIAVEIPRELAGKDVEVEIVPGYDAAPEVAAPETVDELLANESRQNYLPRSVVVQFRVPSQGVTFEGHVAPRLPGFALDALRPAHSDTGPEPYLSYSRTVVPLDWFFEGHDKVRVKVKEVLR
jgi:hypothetical protein